MLGGWWGEEDKPPELDSIRAVSHRHLARLHQSYPCTSKGMLFKVVVHQGSANTAGLGNTLKIKDKGGEEANGKKKKKRQGRWNRKKIQSLLRQTFGAI